MKSIAKIDLTLTDNRAVASLTVPGISGALVTRHGKDDREALSATLRALADLIDSRRRDTTRKNVETTWVRVSMDVDVKVPQAEADRAVELEERVMEGNRTAGVELLDLSTDWLRAALDDGDSREFQSFSWSLRDDCEEFDEA
jgi:hypothetical protein